MLLAASRRRRREATPTRSATCTEHVLLKPLDAEDGHPQIHLHSAQHVNVVHNTPVAFSMLSSSSSPFVCNRRHDGSTERGSVLVIDSQLAGQQGNWRTLTCP